MVLASTLCRQTATVRMQTATVRMQTATVRIQTATVRIQTATVRCVGDLVMITHKPQARHRCAYVQVAQSASGGSQVSIFPPRFFSQINP